VYERSVRHLRGTLVASAFVVLVAGCGAHAREVELVEMQNARVDDVPVGLHTVESRRIWRDGRRIDVEFATLLVLDRATNTIVAQKVSEGDEIILGGKAWSVIRVEPGTSTTSSRVVLREAR
jgi:hypothetical protein